MHHCCVQAIVFTGLRTVIQCNFGPILIHCCYFRYVYAVFGTIYLLQFGVVFPVFALSLLLLIQNTFH